MSDNDPQRKIFQLNSKPGIQRDGTMLDSGSYVDGQWVRFTRSRPRKMGGFKSIVEDLVYQPRGIHTFSRNNTNLLYFFSSNDIRVTAVDNNATGALTYDVTPTAFVANTAYQWQVDRVFDATGGGTNLVIAHPATNLNDIANQTETPIYYATAGATGAPFAKLNNGVGGDVTCSGGIVTLHPYVFAYGSDGLIKNCNANNPNDWRITVGGDADEVNVAGTKIVKGLALRGGGRSPAGLFWSLDSVIKVTWAGQPRKFDRDTVSTNSTVLSSNGIVEYDGIYFWVGIDRFYLYDGRVQELPNQMNVNWFFDNLNFEQRQKVWATVVPRWGEIWWHFPYGTNQVECNRAVIFNVREKCWYDCQIERGCGVPAKVLRFPIWCGNRANKSTKYIAHAHETGYNKVEAGQEVAIQSYIESHDFGYPTGGAVGEQPVGNDYWTRLSRVEPDGVISGGMTLTVKGTEFANGAMAESSYTFDGTTTKIDMREQRRMMRLRLESNEVGGHFELGRTIIHTEPGDVRS